MLRNTPLIQELIHESQQEMQVKQTLHVLKGRFGPPGPAVEAGLKRVEDEAKQLELALQAATCADLAAFKAALKKELPKPAPASTRGRRKPKKAD